MVGTKSALEANDSQEDLEVSRSKRGKLFRSEGPRHTHVQRGLNHFGLQHSDYFYTRLSGVVVLSYNSGPDCLGHARMGRMRPSISSERCNAAAKNTPNSNGDTTQPTA